MDNRKYIMVTFMGHYCDDDVELDVIVPEDKYDYVCDRIEDEKLVDSRDELHDYNKIIEEIPDDGYTYAVIVYAINSCMGMDSSIVSKVAFPARCEEEAKQLKDSLLSALKIIEKNDANNELSYCAEIQDLRDENMDKTIDSFIERCKYYSS